MISQPDRAWCPDCRTSRWSYQTTDDGDCEKCGADVIKDWPLWARAYRRGLQVIGVAIGAAVLLGPPVWAVWRAVTYDGPLYATRTVTTTQTQHYGLILDVGNALAPWVVILLILLALPVAPRRL